MGGVWRIGFLALAVLVAYNGDKQDLRLVEGPAKELSAIDSLLWRQPDSALAMLQDYLACRDVARNVSNANDTIIEDVARYVSTTAYDRHYANLLLAELLYKNYYAQTNRAELLQAVGYFDSLALIPRGHTHALRRHCGLDPQSPCQYDNLVFLDARAHYINGVGYYEHDSVVPACKGYMKALEVMEEHFKEKELVGKKAKFMALTYTHLAGIYSDYYLHEQAIYFGQQSLLYYQEYDAIPWHLAWVLNDIGTHFDMMKQLDSAGFYYQNAIEILNDTTLLVYRDIKAHQAFLRYEISGQTDISIDRLFGLLLEAEDESEQLARCLSIGELFFQDKQFDSASFYLERVFDRDSKTDCKKQAAEWLVEICKTQGKNEEALKYADFLVPFANQDENNGAIKSQLSESYNSFRKRELDRQHKKVLRETIIHALVVSGGLIIVILVTLLLYHQNKKKLRLLESEKLEDNASSSKAWQQYAAFLEEPICQVVVHSVQGENIKRLATPKDFPNLVLSDEQLQQLAITVNRYFGPFEYHLEQHGIKASPVMVSLCHLFLLSIDEKQAAILLDRDYSSISRYVKKLKTAFETQESLVVYFRNLVLNN